MSERETGNGQWLRKSLRTEVIVFRLSAEVQQLWNAMSVQYEMPLNGVAAWVIGELAEKGNKNSRTPPGLGTGLRRPKEKVQSGNRYTKEEKAAWSLMRAQYRVGWAGVLTIALFEQYWRRPVELSLGIIRRREFDDPSWESWEED